AGLEPFDQGQVLVDGEPIRGAGLDRGVVFQSYTLLPWLNARQNIEFALKAAGRSRGECRRIADEHLALVGLEDYAEAYPTELSGGMKQRVRSEEHTSELQSREKLVCRPLLEKKKTNEK